MFVHALAQQQNSVPCIQITTVTSNSVDSYSFEVLGEGPHKQWSMYANRHPDDGEVQMQKACSFSSCGGSIGTFDVAARSARFKPRVSLQQ